MKKRAKLLTNLEIGNTYGALQALAAQVKDMVLRWRILENIDLLNKHRELWLKERNEIISGNTEKDKEGNPKIVKDDYVWTDEAAKEKVLTLDKIETEIQYVRITLSSLAEESKRTGEVIEYSTIFPLKGWLIWNDIPEPDDGDETEKK